MEENEKQTNVQIFSEKKKSRVPKVLIIMIGVIIVSVLSSLSTYFLITKGSDFKIKGANNTTYNVENVENL